MRSENQIVHHTKLRKGDNVIVIAGKQRRQTGKIKQINLKQNRAVVEGLNIIKKHTKPTQSNPNGGIKQFEAPIHLSNLMFYLEKEKKATKIKLIVEKDKKLRMAKATRKML